MKRALLTLSLLLICAQVQAHRPSDSYLMLAFGAAPGSLEGTWQIALRDLDHALRLDDGDGALTWGELGAREQESVRHALARLQISSAEGACAIHSAPLEIAQRADGTYAQLALTVACPDTRALRLSHRFLAELDPDHRALVRVGGSDAAVQVVSAAQGAVRLPSAAKVEQSIATTLHGFVARGIEHIFAGLDHILFLLVLLLPAVLRERGDKARQALRPVLIDVLKIVTAFTLAHSLTLTLSALGRVRVAAGVIEPAIAASVAVAALNNLRPVFDADRWALAFALGLLHGFGFSSVLIDAGLAGSALLPALFGFNLGVELGQLAIVAVFVPLAFRARATSGYRNYALFGGSVVVLAVSLFWLFERIQVG